MRRSLIVLVAPFALLAGGAAIFYGLKQPPQLDQCTLGAAPGVEEYRRGLGAYATFSAAVLGGLVAWISRGRRTAYALGICAWLAALYNLDDDAFQPHALLAFLFALFGGEVLLLAAAIGMFAARRPRIAQLAYLWTALLVFVPAAVTLPAGEGVAHLCLD